MRKFLSTLFIEALLFIAMSSNANASATHNWEAPQTVAENPQTISPMAFNAKDQAVMTWIDSSGNARIAFKEGSGPWMGEQQLQASAFTPATPFPGIDSSGQVFVVWVEGQHLFFAKGAFNTPLTRQDSGITFATSPNAISSLTYTDNDEAVVVSLQTTPNTMNLTTYKTGFWGDVSRANSKNGSISASSGQKFVGTYKDTSSDNLVSMVSDFAVNPNGWTFSVVGATVNDNVSHSANNVGQVVASWTEQTTNAIKVATFTVAAPASITMAPLTGISPIDAVRTFINAGGQLISSWVDGSTKSIYSTSTFSSNTWTVPATFSDLPGLLGSLSDDSVATFYLSNSVNIAQKTVSNLISQTYNLGNQLKGVEETLVSEPLKVLEGSMQAFYTSSVPTFSLMTMWLTNNPKLQTALGLTSSSPSSASQKLTGSRINNIYPTRKEYINQLKWTAFTTNSNITTYKVYRDGTLIATLAKTDNKNGVYTYNDRAQKKRRFHTYRVDEILSTGTVNISQTIQLP